MENIDLKDLFNKYKAGICTPEELVLLENWYLQWKVEHQQFTEDELLSVKDEVWQEMAIDVRMAKRVRLWPRVVAVASRSKFGTSLAAAAAVTAIALCVYFFNANRHTGPYLSSRVSRDLNDIAPGKNGATITLASGEVIQLSGAKTGVVIGGGSIKYNDGSALSSGATPLSSRANAKDLDSSKLGMTKGELGMTKNQGTTKALTASTAKGQTYQFTLPDGTKVWLNADSKLEFPSNFGDVKQRLVKLSGEGYFEVVHNAKQPFRVESNGQIVEDIGTEFNINAYADESSTRTTLVEGSARVLSSRANAKDLDGVILKPNQQAINNGTNIKIAQADAEDATAWKNGLFIFEDESLQSIMKKVSRWYDVEVVYQQGVDKGQLYGGSVSRYDKVSKVLEGLELTKGIHFKIEGRRITVMQ